MSGHAILLSNDSMLNPLALGLKFKLKFECEVVVSQTALRAKLGSSSGREEDPGCRMRAYAST